MIKSIACRVDLDTVEPDFPMFTDWLNGHGITRSYIEGPNRMEYRYTGSRTALTDMIRIWFDDGLDSEDVLALIEPQEFDVLRKAVYSHVMRLATKQGSISTWGVDLYVEKPYTLSENLRLLAADQGCRVEWFDDSGQLWITGAQVHDMVAVIASQYMPDDWQFNSSVPDVQLLNSAA
jgi:hypothetical protein